MVGVVKAQCLSRERRTECEGSAYCKRIAMSLQCIANAVVRIVKGKTGERSTKHSPCPLRNQAAIHLPVVK